MPHADQLADRSILLTGANRGLGRSVAHRLASAGASMVLVARDPDLLGEVGRELAPLLRPGQHIRVHAADLTNAADCQSAIRLLAELPGKIPVLINNAAVLGPVGPIETNDWTAWVNTLEVNLLAPAGLCRGVIPLMRERGAGKIINLSGGGATNARPNFSAYAVAKTGMVRLTETLAAELRDANIQVNAVAPGPMNTRMTEALMQAGPALAGAEYARSQKQLADGGAPPEKAAELISFLASSRSDGVSGRLLSAVWDDWEKLALAERRQTLDSSDIYMLRRIVAKDRGLDWDA